MGWTMRFYVALGDSVGLIANVRVIEAKSVLAAKRQVCKIDNCYGKVFIFERMGGAFEMDPDSLVALHPGKETGCTWMEADEEGREYFKREIERAEGRGITFIGRAPKRVEL